MTSEEANLGRVCKRLYYSASLASLIPAPKACGTAQVGRGSLLWVLLV